jgi:hypothetical protein
MSHSKLGLGSLLLAVPAIALLTGCPEEEPEDYGTINYFFDRAGAEDPFTGTTEVVLSADYLDDCLAGEDGFYTTNPQYLKDGKDGAAAFEEWAGRLCDPGEDFNARGIDCEVKVIEQIDATDRFTLRVTYEIFDDDMTQRELAFGPLPTEHLAGCEPRVQLFGDAAFGRNSQGDVIWSVQTLPGSPTAATNQGAPMIIEIKRN